jgi:uncharacterized protein YndB with AHSA1/START domain
MSDERRIEVEVEVPATLEQAWEAIATGSGITAWFMPAEVEGRVGGSVVHRQEGYATSSGTVTAYDPPRRFAYEEEIPLGDEEPVRAIATEFLVEARGGGTCVVRVVMSGFGEGEAWERAIESFAAGWRQVLVSLRLYLTHFAGEPAASVNAGAPASGDAQVAWSELCTSLGLPARPSIGERVAAIAPDAPALAGRVEEADERMLTLVLEEPARGLGFVGVGGADKLVYVVRAQFFGPDAAKVAARTQEEWDAWLAHVPAAA